MKWLGLNGHLRVFGLSIKSGLFGKLSFVRLVCAEIAFTSNRYVTVSSKYHVSSCMSMLSTYEHVCGQGSVSCDTLRAGVMVMVAELPPPPPRLDTTASLHPRQPGRHTLPLHWPARAKLGPLRYIELEHTEGEGVKLTRLE